MSGSRLHFVNGSHLDVDETPDDIVERLDAGKAGFAELQQHGRQTVRVHAGNVLYIEARSEGRAMSL
jgi:hypothetical protein